MDSLSFMISILYRDIMFGESEIVLLFQYDSVMN